MIIYEELYCGWVCPECCEEFGWIEDRIIPNGRVVSCENCQKELNGENSTLKHEV